MPLKGVRLVQLYTSRGVTGAYAQRSFRKEDPMTTEKYLISSPTIALLLEDGRQVAHLVRGSHGQY